MENCPNCEILIRKHDALLLTAGDNWERINHLYQEERNKRLHAEAQMELFRDLLDNAQTDLKDIRRIVCRDE